jgi:NAD(P)H-dependent flavin oxidoreductase YrpB (nitropropane dioxygenase family)
MNRVSGADLVAAVSNAGGPGTLGLNAGAKDITPSIPSHTTDTYYPKSL